MKTCRICKEEKPINSFPFRSKLKNILRNECRSCTNKRKLRWSHLNPEKKKLIEQNFYKRHRQKYCSYCTLSFIPKGDNKFCCFKCNILGNSKMNEQGCLEWMGATGNSGYGKVQRDNKTLSSHRSSYFIFKGPIPNKLLVLHTCDNRRCVNPEHLYLGTHKDNARDAMERDRLKNIRDFFKYSWKQAEECFNLKNTGMTYEDISKTKNIPFSSVAYLVRKFKKTKT